MAAAPPSPGRLVGPFAPAQAVGGAPPVDERHDREARAGMLRETLEVSNYSTVTHLAVSVILGCLFWGHAPAAYLVALNVAMFAVVSTTMGLTFWSRRRLGSAMPEGTVRRGVSLAKLAALLIGLLWSTMPAMLIPSHEGGYQLVAVAPRPG